MQFQIFSEKIEFSKLNLKIEFHEQLNGSWKVLGCNTGHGHTFCSFRDLKGDGTTPPDAIKLSEKADAINCYEQHISLQ